MPAGSADRQRALCRCVYLEIAQLTTLVRMNTSAVIKVATWNVNSARARIERIVDFLDAHKPDVVCLQEIKSTQDTFPFAAIEQAGYVSAIFGQPAYNGVALLSRQVAEDVETGLDDEARVIAGTLFGMRMISVYVPNGQRIGSPKHQYKLQWLDKLASFLEEQRTRYGEFVVAGDYNVAPEDVDIAHPDEWEGKVLSDPAARAKLENIISRFELVDVLRKHNTGPGVFTWWDYRTRGYVWNDGVRIDHILATPGYAARSVHAWVDVEERGGSGRSDHVPVLARLSVGV